MNIIKKLPKIYQNDINKSIRNNKETFYSYSSKNEERVNVVTSSDVELILDGIFNGIKQPYNVPVIVKTSTNVYDTFLIFRTSTYVLTLDQDKIKIEDIVSIQRKNP